MRDLGESDSDKNLAFGARESVGQPPADAWEALGGEASRMNWWQEEIGEVAAPESCHLAESPDVKLPGVEQLSQWDREVGGGESGNSGGLVHKAGCLGDPPVIEIDSPP